MQKLLKFLPDITLWVCIAAYLAITLSAVFTQNHILYNIEPYPDGILYALSARNFALNKGFHLLYENNATPLWVPPLYSWSLIPGYIVSSNPATFYVSNVVLGAISIYLLFLLVKTTFKNSWAGVVAVVVYCVHPLIMWLPTVPMTENLTLLLVIVSLFGVLQEKPSKKTLVLSFMAAIALVFTRYAVVLTAGIITCLLALKIYKANVRQGIVALFIVVAGLIVLEVAGFGFLDHIYYLAKSVFTQNQFYNVSHISENTHNYVSSLLGLSGNFLWLLVPLSTAFLSIPALLFLVFKSIKGKKSEKIRAWSLLLIFLSQLPLLLIFYSVDSRYLVLTIPLIAIGWGWLSSEFLVTQKIIFIIFLALMIVAQLFVYKALLKELLANNLLHRSNAWQHQSIQHFNTYFAQSNQKPILITALPPHLVDAYQTSEYQLLPLSESQEFLQKGEWVWSQDWKTDNLPELYTNLLQEGHDAYVTNAYITHQKSVIEDYETYKTQFTFELVSEGCLSACNIYKLAIQSDTAINSSLDQN